MSRSSYTQKLSLGLAFVVAAATGLVAWTGGVASAASVDPPSGIRTASVSATSFTIATNTSTNAIDYRMYVSSVKDDVYYANITANVRTSARRTVDSTTPSITVSGLTYTNTPYYYRIVAINGASQRYSDIYSIGLRPSTPTSLVAHTGSMGTYLTWSAGSATSFIIAQGTNSALTTGRHDYLVRGETHQFTPYNLVKGTTYYYRIRADNNYTPSYYSTGYTKVTVANSGQVVRALTFNVLQLSSDGQSESGQTIAPWSARRVVAAGMIKQYAPDVAAIQEAWPYTQAAVGPRQIDSLVSALGAPYKLAQTEIPPPKSGYFRTGEYIIYNSSVLTTVGTGGNFKIGDSRYAAYQIMQNRHSGARFLFTSVHTIYGTGSVTYDDQRQREVSSFLSQAKAYAAAKHVPVIYGGDFNSDNSPSESYDAAGRVMAAAKIADARLVAQSLTNSQYDSANDYLRTPPAYGLSIDHFYAPAGTAIYSWRLVLNLSHGAFVGTIASDHNPLYASIVVPY
jgi:endonuclease/exonuclease/phosphatase family metal-dependent hydrolase